MNLRRGAIKRPGGRTLCKLRPLQRFSPQGRLDRVPVRGVQAEQVLPEEVPPLAVAVSTAVAMSSAGNDDELEFLVGPDQGIDQPER